MKMYNQRFIHVCMHKMPHVAHWLSVGEGIGAFVVYSCIHESKSSSKLYLHLSVSAEIYDRGTP